MGDDFGPSNLRSVHTLREIVESKRTQHPSEVPALQCRPDPPAVTDAVFLMGSFMIMCVCVCAQMIIAQGTVGDEMYLIKHGTVEVTVRASVDSDRRLGRRLG